VTSLSAWDFVLPMCPYFKTTNYSTSTLTKEPLLLGKIVQFVSTKDVPSYVTKSQV